MTDTRFEKARIIGARALQISLGAPILIDVDAAILDSGSAEGKFDPVNIAIAEYDEGVIPITVTRD